MSLTILMVTYILIFLLVVFSSKKEINKTIPLTASYIVRALSIFFIVLHHIAQRVDCTSVLAIPFLNFVYLFVGLFFFLSGYGNGVSLEKAKKIPVNWLGKRLLTMVFFYIVGLGLNVLINMRLYEDYSGVLRDFLHLTYSPYTLWFFKVLLVCYLLTFLVAFFERKVLASNNANLTGGGIIMAASLIFIFLCLVKQVPNYWWNSVIAYPLGYMYAHKKDSCGVKSIYVVIAFLVFLVTAVLGMKITLLQIFATISFSLIFVWFLSNFSFRKNRGLQFIGKLSLGIYLYHTVLLTALKPVMNEWYAPMAIICGSVIFAFCTDFVFGLLIGRRREYK